MFAKLFGVSRPAIITRYGFELSEDEIFQMNEASVREFGMKFEVNDATRGRLYFLLKDGNTILAQGALGEVSPVIFDGVTYSILGIYDVIAHTKKRGYGKKVLLKMKEYLISRNRVGLGFCMPLNAQFYEKCGFGVEKESTHRFVFLKNEERIVNKDGQYVIYLDASNTFIKKVLADSEKEVILPTEGLW